MLLEVLIAIAIMVLAIATIGSQVRQSLDAAEYADKLNRALMLAEWVMAELDLPADEEDQLIDIRGEEGEGTFGERYPGFGWRIEREPTDVDNFDLITLDILTGDPEEESADEWKVLHSVYFLQPVVAELDPSDFGMPSEEEIGLLASAGVPAAGGADPTAGALPAEAEEILAALPGPIQEIFQRFMGGESVPLDEVRLAFSELSTEDLLGLLTTPALLGMFSGGMSGMAGQMLGGQGGRGLDQAMQGGGGSLEQMLPGGMSGSGLRQQLQNLMPNR